jgi:hypothetical protein
MNERQRADQLARAIDELINGTPRRDPSASMTRNYNH